MKTIEQLFKSQIGMNIRISPANLWRKGLRIKPIAMRYKVELMFPYSNRPDILFTNNPSVGIYFFLLDSLRLCRKYNIGNANQLLTLMKICRG